MDNSDDGNRGLVDFLRSRRHGDYGGAQERNNNARSRLLEFVLRYCFWTGKSSDLPRIQVGCETDRLQRYAVLLHRIQAPEQAASPPRPAIIGPPQTIIRPDGQSAVLPTTVVSPAEPTQSLFDRISALFQAHSGIRCKSSMPVLADIFSPSGDSPRRDHLSIRISTLILAVLPILHVLILDTTDMEERKEGELTFAGSWIRSRDGYW
jgi:hypothetical protein